MSRIVRYGFINGLPGFVTIEPDDTLQTNALEIEDGKIVAIYVMRNPDKLLHLGGMAFTDRRAILARARRGDPCGRPVCAPRPRQRGDHKGRPYWC
jgi:hypothetical protein